MKTFAENFGTVVPAAGLPRPKSARPMINPTAATSWYTVERLCSGKYKLRYWISSRNSIYPQELGQRYICVVDDFGDLVVVEDGGRAWW